jgi:ribosomal protein S18 acetylase RimI-like enzyme
VTVAFEVRPARHDDVAQITPWTTDTFDWGDYVADRLPTWIDDPEAHPLVCVDESGSPVAVSNTTLLSPTEAWLEGARVHPDHQRSGMGTAMNQAGTAWARERGARVARLATEAVNLAARRQVEALGYRNTGSWAHAEIDPRGHAPVDRGRGLRQATVADVDAAWLSWSTGELSRAARDLRAIGWRWRRARPDDLTAAAVAGELLQSPLGWMVVEQPGPEWIRTGWVITGVEDAPAMVDGLIGLAMERGVEEVSLMMPWLPWVTETLTRAGASPDEVLIYSLGL